MLCTTKKGYTLALTSDYLEQDRRCIILYDYGNFLNQNKNSIFLLFKDRNLVFYSGKFWSLRQKYHEFIEQLL